MEFKNFLFLSLGALLVTAYKILKQVGEGVKLNIATIFAEICIALVFSFMVVPYLMNKYQLDIYGGLLIVGALSLFSKIVVQMAEGYLKKNVQSKIDKL
jgi:hypothetical protein